MENRSRIRFYPLTKEMEIEGSEVFVKAYFNKIKQMISGAPVKIATIQKVAKARTAKKAEKKAKAVNALPAKMAPKAVAARPQNKVKKSAKKKPDTRRVTNVDAVVTLIQGSAEGISIAELKEKTGLTGQQISYIINRAAKKGKIRKTNRGIWCGVPASQEQKTE